MRVLTTILTCFLLAACQGGEEAANNTAPVETTKAVNISVPLDGEIILTAEPLASESAACVIPLRISNGTEAEITASMFGFAVTGPGDDDTGNMFPQEIPSGEYRTARIIQIGQSCDAFDTITLGDVLCKEKADLEKSCEVSFEDSDEIRFVSPN